MENSFTTPITYFLEEGQANLIECMRIAFNAARQHNVNKIVVFTARGRGLRLALDEYLSKPEFSHIKLIGVRFPAGKIFTNENGEPITVDFEPDGVKHFIEQGIAIIRANLPFEPIRAHFANHGTLAQDLALIGNALSIFGGSMSLCVQATLMACDAGEVEERDHVIALTSDTAILAQAATTAEFLTQFVIREVLCKPAIFTTTKHEEGQSPRVSQTLFPANSKLLEG